VAVGGRAVGGGRAAGAWRGNFGCSSLSHLHISHPKTKLQTIWGKSIKRMVCTAQDVPREYQLMFGCTRLHELKYFCMLQSTQQMSTVSNTEYKVTRHLVAGPPTFFQPWKA
jgi:hypothetical protein